MKNFSILNFIEKLKDSCVFINENQNITNHINLYFLFLKEKLLKSEINNPEYLAVFLENFIIDIYNLTLKNENHKLLLSVNKIENKFNLIFKENVSVVSNCKLSIELKDKFLKIYFSLILFYLLENRLLIFAEYFSKKLNSKLTPFMSMENKGKKIKIQEIVRFNIGLNFHTNIKISECEIINENITTYLKFNINNFLCSIKINELIEFQSDDVIEFSGLIVDKSKNTINIEVIEKKEIQHDWLNNFYQLYYSYFNLKNYQHFIVYKTTNEI